MLDHDEAAYAYELCAMPNSAVHGLWEELYFDTDVKVTLLNYAFSALLFSKRGVNPSVINWNRLVLLYGPPG